MTSPHPSAHPALAPLNHNPGALDPTDLRALLGKNPTHTQTNGYASNGWNRPLINQVLAAAAYAVDHRTPFAAAAHDRCYPTNSTSHRQAITDSLVYTAHKLLTEEHTPLPLALAWATLLTTAPTHTDLTALETLLDTPTAPPLDHTNPLTRWLALGQPGPLAYTAGLTLTEAETQHTTNTHDPAAHAALAALRNWTHPHT